MNYNKSFSGGHNLYMTAGHEVQEDMSRNVTGALQQISDPFFQQRNVIGGSGALQFAGGGYSVSGFHSLFGRLNYDFQSKYFIQGSVRRDGQSSLSPNNRFGIFPGGTSINELLLNVKQSNKELTQSVNLGIFAPPQSEAIAVNLKNNGSKTLQTNKPPRLPK
jgi:hypothetical protein